jgi:hypothetical protein
MKVTCHQARHFLENFVQIKRSARKFWNGPGLKNPKRQIPGLKNPRGKSQTENQTLDESHMP